MRIIPFANHEDPLNPGSTPLRKRQERPPNDLEDLVTGIRHILPAPECINRTDPTLRTTIGCACRPEQNPPGTPIPVSTRPVRDPEDVAASFHSNPLYI